MNFQRLCQGENKNRIKPVDVTVQYLAILIDLKQIFFFITLNDSAMSTNFYNKSKLISVKYNSEAKYLLYWLSFLHYIFLEQTFFL